MSALDQYEQLRHELLAMKRDVGSLKKAQEENSKVIYHSAEELKRLNDLIDSLYKKIDDMKDTLRASTICITKLDGNLQSMFLENRNECIEKNIIPMRERLSSISTRVVTYGAMAALGMTIIANMVIAFITKFILDKGGG